MSLPPPSRFPTLFMSFRVGHCPSPSVSHPLQQFVGTRPFGRSRTLLVRCTTKHLTQSRRGLPPHLRLQFSVRGSHFSDGLQTLSDCSAQPFSFGDRLKDCKKRPFRLDGSRRALRRLLPSPGVSGPAAVSGSASTHSMLSSAFSPPASYATHQHTPLVHRSPLASSTHG